MLKIRQQSLSFLQGHSFKGKWGTVRYINTSLLCRTCRNRFCRGVGRGANVGKKQYKQATGYTCAWEGWLAGFRKWREMERKEGFGITAVFSLKIPVLKQRDCLLFFVHGRNVLFVTARIEYDCDYSWATDTAVRTFLCFCLCVEDKCKRVFFDVQNKSLTSICMQIVFKYIKMLKMNRTVFW